jgi:cytochrome c oxidase assembly factor CtaG
VISLEQLFLAALLLVAARLYVAGSRRTRALGRPVRHAARRGIAFAAALVLLELALCAPFDRVAEKSLAAHMLQHVVLMSFVPPLLVLAAPWMTVWRGLPLAARRRLARWLLAFPASLRRGARTLVSPWPAFLLITIDLGAWHLPWLYDLTLRSGIAHYAEHVTFLLFGTLFWIPVLESPRFRPRLSEVRAVGYVIAGAATGWVLAVVLALAPSPLYPGYATLPHRLFGVSALGDQQLAAGIMLGIGSIPFTIAVFAFLYRWLDEERAVSPPHRRARAVELG